VDHKTVFPLSGSNNTQQLDSHRDIRLLLVRNLIEETGKSQNHPTPRLVGRPSAGTKNVLRLESRHKKTLASEIINQTMLLPVFFSRPKRGHRV